MAAAEDNKLTRSQLDYCLRLKSFSGMIYSRSIRDIAVSLSSAEAELRALKELTMDIIWFRLLLSELLFPQPAPTIVYEYNSAVITLVESVKTHPRTRHLNKIRNFIIQEISVQTLVDVKVPGADNVADIFNNTPRPGIIYQAPLYLTRIQFSTVS